MNIIIYVIQSTPKIVKITTQFFAEDLAHMNIYVQNDVVYNYIIFKYIFLFFHMILVNLIRGTFSKNRPKK